MAREPQISAPIGRLEAFLVSVNKTNISGLIFFDVLCTYLDFLLVKHTQPLKVDHIGQALSEGQAMRPDLLVEPVVSH